MFVVQSKVELPGRAWRTQRERLEGTLAWREGQKNPSLAWKNSKCVSATTVPAGISVLINPEMSRFHTGISVVIHPEKSRFHISVLMMLRNFHISDFCDDANSEMSRFHISVLTHSEVSRFHTGISVLIHSEMSIFHISMLMTLRNFQISPQFSGSFHERSLGPPEPYSQTSWPTFLFQVQRRFQTLSQCSSPPPLGQDWSWAVIKFLGIAHQCNVLIKKSNCTSIVSAALGNFVALPFLCAHSQQGLPHHLLIFN